VNKQDLTSNYLLQGKIIKNVLLDFLYLILNHCKEKERKKDIVLRRLQEINRCVKACTQFHGIFPT